jgi:predicted dehydrogenase
MNISTLRVFVVGCGSIAQRHIDNLQGLGIKNIEAFDIQPSRRYEVASRFGVSTVESMEEGWLSNPQIALIATPTSSHIPIALEAAKHDCHIFVEKPLGDTTKGISNLISEVKERNLITLVGCNMRFHPGLIQVKKILEEGIIGRMHVIRAQAGQWLPDWHPWEDYRKGYSANKELGGGVLLDQIHELDYAQWLVGSRVQQVACFVDKMSSLDIDTEDTAAILVRFNNGIVGEIHVDYIQRVHSRSCHIIGENGTIVWDYEKGEVSWRVAEQGYWQTFTNPVGWDLNQMYLDEMRHFLTCVSQNEESVSNVLNGSEVLRIALAAKSSANTGKIVDLDSIQY